MRLSSERIENQIRELERLALLAANSMQTQRYLIEANKLKANLAKRRARSRAYRDGHLRFQRTLIHEATQ